jgi:predicted  nucleic acid-binding Zn-ribbon protein
MNKILIIIFSSTLLFGGVHGISLDSRSSTTSVSDKAGSSDRLEMLKIERDEMESQILTTESFIDIYKENQVDKWKNLIEKNPNSPMVPKWQEAFNDTSGYLEELKADLVTLQQQLTKIDAQITALTNKT